MVRNFADYTESTISLLLKTEGEISNLLTTHIGGDFNLTPVLVETGALAGGLLLAGENVHYSGLIVGYERELQQLLSQSLATGEGYRTLLGFSWNLLVPAKKYLLVVRTLPENSSPEAAIALLYSLEPLYASMHHSQRMILGYLSVNFIILVIVGLYRFRRFTVAPIDELIRLTDAYEEDGSVPFLTLEQGNELGQLSSALNQMLLRIEHDKKKLQQSVVSLEAANKELVSTREEIVHAEKLASVGRLAAGLAHEIGNPISVVQGYLGLLQQDDLTSIERKDFAQRSENELQRINRLIRQLLDFSRINSEPQEEVSLHAVLQRVIEMVSCQPFMEGIAVHCDFAAENDVVRGGFDPLQQVFLNCLLNAADAIGSAPDSTNKIDLRTSLDGDTTKPDKWPSILVSITDTGIGIAEQDRANIFDPFFTTKEPGKGTGLGLSVAYSIIESCKGAMRVESKQGKGTTVFVELPLVCEVAG